MKINCHCHIFTLDCVPLGFRQRFSLNFRNERHRLLHRLVRAILMPGVRLERWLGFAYLDTASIARHLIEEMDEAGIEMATPLMVDMTYDSAYPEKDVKDWNEQIRDTLAAVAAVNEAANRRRLLPFIGADPRRPGVADLVIGHLAERRFFGVKVYPVMGFEPDDERLYPIYDWCQRHRIPVTTHCERGGLPGHDGYYDLAAPELWEPVLRRFPELVLNLAHFDRTDTPWQLKIKQMMREWPNLYSDISFDAEMFLRPARYFAGILAALRTPVVQDRLLYGTDWYMGRFLWTEKSYIEWYTKGARRIFWAPVRFLKSDIRRLTEKNPARFLAGVLPT
ncbi:MAG TPA: amidohydrolase family protein [Candidatus Ozemobacteraceae bacterium]|nr:amidohydrolase family protein [Candidatus Ozemobacteraceae bacterium]